MKSNSGEYYLIWITAVLEKLIIVHPAPTTLPGPEFQSHVINPFLPIHRPDFLSHILQPFPDDAPSINMANYRNDSTNYHHHHHTPNSSRHCPDTNSKSLEHHLDSTLEILIQTSGILADGITPQARNTLKAINALVSTEAPTPSYVPPPRFKSVRKVAKWLQISRSPGPKWSAGGQRKFSLWPEPEAQGFPNQRKKKKELLPLLSEDT